MIGLVVAGDQMLQEAEDRAAQSDTSSVPIPVDGEAVRFALARDRTGAWCAAAKIGSVGIRITGNEVDLADVRLVALADSTG